MRGVAALLPLALLLIVSAVRADEPAQARIGALLAGLRANAIQRVEVFQIPASTLTRSRITPDRLEGGFDYHLVIREFRGNSYAASLLDAVAATKVAPADDMGDVRWGLVFFGADGQRAVSLYFDPSNRRGGVDTVPVTFDGGLLKWLNGNFGKAFR